MADVLHPNFRHKMRYTPMRDVVRGRATGRLYWRGRVRASGLPTPIQDLIMRVVRRTRLWSLEKADVADELIAHFADAIEAGKCAEDAIRSFGDERRAARLIRRASRSNRLVAWHVLRIIGWIVFVGFVCYVSLGIYLYQNAPGETLPEKLWYLW
jgi:hypothetical protein